MCSCCSSSTCVASSHSNYGDVRFVEIMLTSLNQKIRGFSMQQLAGAVAGTRGENFQWNSRRVFLMFKKELQVDDNERLAFTSAIAFEIFWVLRLVDNLLVPWFYTNWHWVHSRNSGVLGEYLCSAPVLLWIRSTLWTSTWGQGRGFSPISLHPKLPPSSSIHPSFPCHLRRSGYASQMIAPRLRIISVLQCLLEPNKKSTKSAVRTVSVWCPLDFIEIIHTFQWNELCGTFCLSQGPASTSLDWSFG